MTIELLVAGNHSLTYLSDDKTVIRFGDFSDPTARHVNFQIGSYGQPREVTANLPPIDVWDAVWYLGTVALEAQDAFFGNVLNSQQEHIGAVFVLGTDNEGSLRSNAFRHKKLECFAIRFDDSRNFLLNESYVYDVLKESTNGEILKEFDITGPYFPALSNGQPFSSACKTFFEWVANRVDENLEIDELGVSDIGKRVPPGCYKISPDLRRNGILLHCDNGDAGSNVRICVGAATGTPNLMKGASVVLSPDMEKVLIASGLGAWIQVSKA